MRTASRRIAKDKHVNYKKKSRGEDVQAPVIVGAHDVLLLEAADEGVEVLVVTVAEMLVPPAMLEDVVSAMSEDTGVVVSMSLAVLDVDDDELLDPATAEVGQDFASCTA